MTNLKRFLFIMALLGIAFNSSGQTISVGSGSYTTTFPGTDVAGRNLIPQGTPMLSGVAATKPVPSSDWFTFLLHPDSKTKNTVGTFNYPLSIRSSDKGLIMSFTVPNTLGNDYRQPMASADPIIVGTQGISAWSTVCDYGDWTVVLDWQNKMKATIGMGMPFVYFTKAVGEVATITINHNPAGAVVHGNKIYIDNNYGGARYIVYAPAGSTWDGAANGGKFTSTLNGQNYWSIVMLPTVLTNSSSPVAANNIVTPPAAITDADALKFQPYAYVFPTDTKVAWNYDRNAGKVVTTFTATTDVKDGSTTNTKMYMGLLPHQWRNLATTSAQPGTDLYPTVRGNMKMIASNSFTVENKFSGVLTNLPNSAKYSNGFDLGALYTKIDQVKSRGLSGWTDSYNEGQAMAELVQMARIADQIGYTEARDMAAKTVKDRLEDWLKAESGEVAFIFYYNSAWSTLIGYPAGHHMDDNLNDKHFHWGYFVSAASAIEQFYPGWAAEWGPMINMLIKDAACIDRNDTKSPFLRNFSPYSGHAWANGFASDPMGNNQESTSESMNFNSALINWGSVTNDQSIVDLGVYLYATEYSAIREYWFDVDQNVLKSPYSMSMASRLWSAGLDNQTFWTQDKAATYGIEIYPVNGGSLYMGYDKSYVDKVWTEMGTNTAINDNTTQNPNLWRDTYWCFKALSDPQAAINYYNNFPTREIKFGVTDAFTYHFLHSLNGMGIARHDITPNHPLAMVFDNSGTKTYVAQNTSNSAITVSYSDGFSMIVPAKTMKTNRDKNVSALLTSNKLEVLSNGSATLTVAISGSDAANVTKVDFYKGATLIGTGVKAGSNYTISTGALVAGLPSFYAKAYVGTDLVLSNVVTIQSGVQRSFGNAGNPWPIATSGSIIESGNYDEFEGGLGIGVSYADSDGPRGDNTSKYRPTEWVDAGTDATEGKIVGWIEAGEWMEYTVNVATEGAYKVDFRYAAGFATAGGPMQLFVDGIKASSDITFSTTGDWSAWSTKTCNDLQLPAGSHVLRLSVLGNGFNLGKMTFTKVGAYIPFGPTCVVNGNQTIELPVNSVSLNGSASSVGTQGSVLSYAWTQESGPSTATLSAATSATTQAQNLVVGTYVFKLTVTESVTLKTDSKTTSVTVNPVPVTPPTAGVNANRTINLPTTASSLDGSSSTLGNGTNVTYAWVQKSGPSTSVLATPSAVTTNVSGLNIEGTWVFELTVSTTNGTSKATTSITVVDPANISPTVVLPAAYSVLLPTNTALLDGSASSVAQGKTATYSWMQTSGPNTATIATPTANKTNVNGLIAGVYVFKLTVSDNNVPVKTSNASTTVTVTSPNVGCGDSNIAGLNGSRFSWSASNDLQPTITFIGVNGSGSSFKELHYSINGSDKGGYLVSGNSYTIPTSIATTKAGDKIDFWYVYTAELGKAGNDQSNNAVQSFNVGSCMPTSVDNLIVKELSIYPNPATDVLNVEIPDGVEMTELFVLNTCGNQVLTQSIIGETVVKVDVSQLNSGIFLIKLVGENQSVVKKFIKK